MLVIGAGLALVSGCGQGAPADPGAGAGSELLERNLVPEAYQGRYRTSASVLESPQHGPQLCFGMASSLPPQCGGPDVLGWDWAGLPSESVGGTTWGSYELVGTFAGGALTLTEPPEVHDPQGDRAAEPPLDDRFASPCPEPAGGWAPVDPARATPEAAEEAQRVAAASSGFAALWVDQRLPEAEITEEAANDPQRYVLNVSTTGDAAELEEELREVWGGSLCVSSAPRSEAELREVHDALPELPGRVFSGTDPFAGVVDLAVVHGTQEQQRALDERFGVGAVRLAGQLEPID